MPNKEEVMDYKWVSIKNLQKDIKNYPEKYTPWMKLIIEKGLFDEFYII
jgi:isopentenyldiphosphate isomerase